MALAEIEPLWTIGDVAAYLQVSAHTVRKWHERGRIPSMKVGRGVRFDPSAVRRWALSQRPSAPATEGRRRPGPKSRFRG